MSFLPIARNRRKEKRFLCSALIQLEVESDLPHIRLFGVLEDISPSGAGVLCEGPIPIGTRARISCLECPNRNPASCDDCRMECEVRSCIPEEDGHRVGLEISGRKWSLGRYEPPHWLRVEQSAADGPMDSDDAA